MTVQLYHNVNLGNSRTRKGWQGNSGLYQEVRPSVGQQKKSSFQVGDYSIIFSHKLVLGINTPKDTPVQIIAIKDSKVRCISRGRYNEKKTITNDTLQIELPIP